MAKDSIVADEWFQRSAGRRMNYRVSLSWRIFLRGCFLAFFETHQFFVVLKGKVFSDVSNWISWKHSDTHAHPRTINKT